MSRRSRRGSKRVNPKKKPATQQDVDRALDEGSRVGVGYASAIFLTVLVDKFGEADRVEAIWKEIVKLSEEVKEGRVSIPDLRRVLLDEYGIEV